MPVEKLTEEQKDKIIRIGNAYITETHDSTITRRAQNIDNYNCYHMRTDYSYKRPGQSTEFLAEQSTMIEQIVNFLQQGLVKIPSWYEIEKPPNVENPLFTKVEIKNLLDHFISEDEGDFLTASHDVLKTGILSSLMITKIRTEDAVRKTFKIRQKKKFLFKKESEMVRDEKKRKKLAFETISFRDLIIDPTGRGLYIGDRFQLDWFEVKRLAEKNPDIYDMDVVELLRNENDEQLEKTREAREKGQDPLISTRRHVVTLFEIWGTLTDPDTGELIAEDSKMTLAQGVGSARHIFEPPRKNPWWHGEHPYVVNPIIRVAKSTHHKALADAGTKHNKTANELFNLIIDAGLKAVHGVTALRKDMLEDPGQVSGGVLTGTTLLIDDSAPLDGKVLERVDTADPAAAREAVEAFRLNESKGRESMFTNDLRLGQSSGARESATAVVEASQSIATVFSGITMLIEVKHHSQVLRKAWAAMMQDFDDFSAPEMVDILGKERMQEIVSLSRQERFVRSVQGVKFKVVGMSQMVEQLQDFRKLTIAIQTMLQIPVMAEAFFRTYDPAKINEQILSNLGIRADRILLDKSEASLANVPDQSPPVPGGPDNLSQVPQESAAGPSGRPPTGDFPRVIATGGVNQ